MSDSPANDTLPGYFIAPDAYADLGVWRERGDNKHRVGDHAERTGPKRRRCLTVDEMTARGMRVNDRGVWTNGGTSPWAVQTSGVDTGADEGAGL